jgi:uncharacterized LabA/DUF88 family protein
VDRFVAFLDVGYLKAASSSTLGRKGPDLRPDPEKWIDWLKTVGQELPGNPTFLRAYWYDGSYDPRHPSYVAQRRYFDRIAKVPGIQLRLGHLQVKKTPKWQYAVKSALKEIGVTEEDFRKHFTFRPELEQKGVDTRITLDMVRLAQQRVYDAAILVGGDRDLAEPVRVAQDEGCRMVVAAPQYGTIAAELKQLADEVRRLSKSDLEPLFQVSQEDSGKAAEPPAGSTESTLAT